MNDPGLFLGRVKVRIEAFEGGADDVIERRVPSPALGPAIVTRPVNPTRTRHEISRFRFMLNGFRS